ncbi:hypothetical protein [Hydrogenophaga sp. IBVHS1]|uniref:hypothetical protein n=1 Tax=unclassified Hydrogenophaga TaxID=2610897 RepID=UPI00117A1B1B|nr:hypothetical protein [Hydrogenophaga sp. IBVHS1]
MTADASVAAGDEAKIRQVIEGYNARDLIGRTFTLSFWVRSSKTGTHCVAFKNAGADRTYVATYTVSAADTWEKKSVTVTGGLITAGTWNWTTGVGLNVDFTLVCGSTFQTTAGAWQTGNFVGTSGQVNCLDNPSNLFAITGVQLEVGAVASPFEHRLYGHELALCHRYFQRFQRGPGQLIHYFPGAGGAAYVDRFAYKQPIRDPSTASATVVGTPNYVNSSVLFLFPDYDAVYARCTVTATGGYSVDTYALTLSNEL